MVVIFRAFVCAALLVCSPALGDGKIFTTGHAAPAEIPEQSALIVYDGKVETLAIETRFVAKGKDFAWVVPLPAKPEIRAGTAGMFPTLRAMFLPRIWVFEEAAPVFGFLGYLAVWAILCMLGLNEIALRFAVFGFLAWFVVCCLLLPALETARAAEGMTGVTVLERSVVGDFDVSVVESPDAGEMSAWLSTNGFQSTADADRAIANYVRNGWVFAVSKLRRSFDDALLSAPTPLIFKFATGNPVYPMQLTGAGATTPLKLELFVFGKAFANASGFESVRRADVRVVEEGTWGVWRGSLEVCVSHTLLREIIGDAPCATQLRRTLLPAEMGGDVQISFAEASKTGNSVASPRAAVQAGIAVGVLAFVVGGLGMMRWASQIGPWPAGFRGIGISLALGCVSGLGLWALTPTMPIAKDSTWSELRRRAEILGACHEVLFPKVKIGLRADLNAAEISNAALQLLGVNPELPSGIRIEDSPGNFVVREIGGEFECVYYTWNGQELVERIR